MSDSDIEVELELNDEVKRIRESFISRNSEKFKARYSPNFDNAMSNPSCNLQAVTGPQIVLNNNLQQSANTQFNTQELLALTNSLPEYAPGSNHSTFISSVDKLCVFLTQQLTAKQTYLLNNAILAKIKNEARD